MKTGLNCWVPFLYKTVESYLHLYSYFPASAGFSRLFVSSTPE